MPAGDTSSIRSAITEASQAMFKAIVDHTPDVAIQTFSRDGVILSWNPASERLYGWSAGDMVGERGDVRFFSGDVFPGLLRCIDSALRSGTGVGPLIFPMRHATGRAITVRSTLFPLPGRAQVACMDVDITALCHESDLRQQVFDRLVDGVVALDTAGAVTLANPSAVRLLGTPIERLIGAKLGELLRLEPAPGGSRDQHLAATAAGRFRVEVVRAALSHRGTELGTAVIIRDITAEHERAEMLRQAQTLSAVGTVAGTLAHDVNNLLAAVQAGAELLAQAPGLDERGRRHVAMIKGAARRGAELVGRLREVGRRGAPGASRFDAGSELRAALDLFAASAPGFQVQASLADGEQPVLGWPGLFQSALINLLINARDASQPAQPIEISSARVEVDPLLAATTRPPLATGPHLRIRIRDAGCGMTPEVLAHCLEPFYSTKGQRGTGLGLASAVACMRDHRGGLLLQSAPGAGTTVDLFVPLDAQA